MEKIIELTKKWHEIVSIDHHKDRDCHFYVTTVYSYGNNPVFRINHYGYIAEDYTEDFETYEEAENGLIEFLKGNILNEKSWAEGVLKEKEKWDSYQIERAENIIKITNPLINKRR